MIVHLELSLPFKRTCMTGNFGIVYKCTLAPEDNTGTRRRSLSEVVVWIEKVAGILLSLVVSVPASAPRVLWEMECNNSIVLSCD